MPGRIGLSLVAAATLIAACGGASAGPAYKASDIVSHFAAPPELGASRALCVGTESECAKSVPSGQTRVTAGAFNLRINFEYNSDTLTQSARQNLDEFAKALKDPQLTAAAFVVEGHTDGVGSDEYNLDLSVRRANAVVAYLETRGVPNAKLEAKGYGKQHLLVPDPMSSSNRRVETRLRD